MKNRILFILAVVMVVNALAYGMIIPLLYPFAAKFGLDAVGLSVLFASFSIAQFIATPIIGRLSDRFGRKPLLLGCLLGTGISLAMFASAQAVWMLFLSRIIDGVTGGNNSVAQAIIADTTEGSERTKAFGILGAAFGFGFLFGPALGGLIGHYYGITAPFWIAAVVAIVSTVAGWVLLPETLAKKQQSQVKKEGLFEFHRMVTALTTPVVGLVLLITMLSSTAQNSFVIGFQSFSVDVMHLSPTMIGLIFTLFGLVGVVMQMAGIKVLLSYFKSKKVVLTLALYGSLITMVALAVQNSLPLYVGINFIYAIMFAPIFVMAPGLISERTKSEDQGVMLGINQSYLSLGQILGPVVAGAVSVFSIRYAFLAAAAFYGFSIVVAHMLKVPKKQANL
jgi:multidrug resistance protein